MYNHICTQFTTFSFILIKAKKPFSFDFNNKKRKRKRKREKACSCLFPIFFSHFFLSIIISNLLKHMKRRQNIEVHTYEILHTCTIYKKYSSSSKNDSWYDTMCGCFNFSKILRERKKNVNNIKRHYHSYTIAIWK